VDHGENEDRVELQIANEQVFLAPIELQPGMELWFRTKQFRVLPQSCQRILHAPDVLIGNAPTEMLDGVVSHVSDVA
jgi:hypothetical protein